MRRDPIVLFLFAGYVGMIALLLIARWWFPSDRELFTYMSATATGFGSAFFTWLKNPPPPNGTA